MTVPPVAIINVLAPNDNSLNADVSVGWKVDSLYGIGRARNL